MAALSVCAPVLAFLPQAHAADVAPIAALTLHYQRGDFGGEVVTHGPTIVLLDGTCEKRAGWKVGFIATGERVVELCWLRVKASSVSVEHALIVTKDGQAIRIPLDAFREEETYT